MKDYYKRFVVMCGGLIMAAFDSVSEAEEYLDQNCSPYSTYVALIYDLEQKREVLTIANI